MTEPGESNLQNASQMLINSYSKLNEDLLRELVQSRIDLEAQLGFDPQCSSCPKCALSSKMVQNLLEQLTNLKGEKFNTWRIWQTSLEHIENLEKSLESTQPLLQSVQRSTELSRKVSFLEGTLRNLEEEHDKALQEKHKLKDELLRTKLQFEKEVKSHRMAQAGEMERIRAEYKKEVEHLRRTIEKMREGQRGEYLEKLEKDRQEWRVEENERIAKIRAECIIRLEPLILEQDALLLQLEELKARMSVANMNIETLETQNNDLKSENAKLLEGSKALHDQFQGVREEIERIKSFPPTENPKTIQILDNLKKEKHELEEEYMEMLKKRKRSEEETRGVISRLEDRLKSVEKQNYTLQVDLCTAKEEVMRSKMRGKSPGVPQREFDLQMGGDDIELGGDSGVRSGRTRSRDEAKILNLEGSISSLQMQLSLEKDRGKMREKNMLNKLKFLKSDYNRLMELYSGQLKVSAKWENEYKLLFNKTRKFIQRQ